MQNQQPVFKALADPTRRDIIGLLSGKSMTVNEISTHFEMSRPAVTKHLGILKDSQIIKIEARGRERISSLNPQALSGAADWITHYSRIWDERLLSLKTAIEDT